MKASKLILPQLIVAALFFIQPTIAGAQVSGCKDPAANNYNPSATVNDGSCTYNPASYTPPVKVNPLNGLLDENSGLQWAGNSLWTFNDGGGAAAIYRIDTASNAILQTVSLSNATNVDWEDIAFDGTYFYVGDFGNNATGIRTDLKIYKFPISAIPDYAANPTVTLPSAQIEVINFRYSDQTDFSKDTSNYTKFDCEALIVDAGKIHLFTKNWIDTVTTHYVIDPSAAGPYTATPLETLNTKYLVTAAGKAPGLNVVVLLGYQNGLPGNHYLHLLSDFNGGYYFNGNKRRLDLPDALTMGQAEGLTFRNGSYGYISNERIAYGPFVVTQKLRTFNTGNLVPAYVLPVDLKAFTVQKQNGKQLINWSFASPVNDLRLLHSSDGVNFSVLKSLGSSSDGSFAYEPLSANNCYKLVWRQAAGGYKYSNIVCTEEKAKPGINNLALQRSGALSFVTNATEADDYVFRLISTDGRLLAQTVQRISAAGLFTVRVAQNIPGNDLILVQMIGRKNQYVRLVKISD